jgi:hypothetical protein
MSYYQKFMTTVECKKWVLLLTAGFFTLTSMAQHHVNFSGEWKLSESKSDLTGNFPLCIFGGDRMRSKTMKIAAKKDFLTVDVAGSSPDGSLVTRQEKLVFDAKESRPIYVGTPREMSAAKWSHDGQTMTIHSVRSFDTEGKTADFKVTEIWKLINGGKSMSIRVTSNSISRENTMTLVYDRQKAADYRF